VVLHVDREDGGEPEGVVGRPPELHPDASRVADGKVPIQEKLKVMK
jgi:hypothetical protein